MMFSIRGAVIAFLFSIAILLFVAFMNTKKIQSTQFYPINKILFWAFVDIVFLLTWIGACPVEDHYMLTGPIVAILYFSYFIINSLIPILWNKIIFKN